LTATGIDIRAAGNAQHRPRAAVNQFPLKGKRGLAGRRLKITRWQGIAENQVDRAPQAAQQMNELIGVPR
jgi:hypothetical protein